MGVSVFKRLGYGGRAPKRAFHTHRANVKDRLGVMATHAARPSKKWMGNVSVHDRVGPCGAPQWLPAQQKRSVFERLGLGPARPQIASQIIALVNSITAPDQDVGPKEVPAVDALELEEGECTP